jgi:mannose-6-phosphate isomerase-like protein (cupin superfamily)
MLVRSWSECVPVTAIDGCLIREVLHPAHEPLPLPYSLAVAEVAGGARTLRHRLAHDEVYFLLEGAGRVHVDAETRDVGAGDAVLIGAGSEQWIENLGRTTLRFVALVSPPWAAAADTRLE